MKNFKLIFYITLILSSITLLEAKEYSSDRYGNININVIDGVMIINDKIESVLHNDEQLSIDIDGDNYEDYGISVDNEIDAMVESEDYSIIVDDDISVDIGELIDISGLIMID